jgi:hypothetical protein
MPRRTAPAQAKAAPIESRPVIDRKGEAAVYALVDDLAALAADLYLEGALDDFDDTADPEEGR